MRRNWEGNKSILENPQTRMFTWVLKRRKGSKGWLEEGKSKKVWQDKRPIGRTEPKWHIGGASRLPEMTYVMATFSVVWEKQWGRAALVWWWWRLSEHSSWNHCSVMLPSVATLRTPFNGNHRPPLVSLRPTLPHRFQSTLSIFLMGLSSWRETLKR